MTSEIKSIEDLMLNITQEIHVKASLEKTFESLLEQHGPYNETLDGKSLEMKIEPWPGGRWYRDLGNSNGHFSGNVQAIKRPTLLEITARSSLLRHFSPMSNIACRRSQAARSSLSATPRLASLPMIIAKASALAGRTCLPASRPAPNPAVPARRPFNNRRSPCAHFAPPT